MENTKDKNATEKNPLGTDLKQYQEYQDLLKIIREDHQKEERKIYIFFVFFFLAFVAIIWLSLVFIDSSFISELRAGNASLTKNTDYLELVLPILIAIAVAFIAFLGINRLKDMDAQVEQIRNSINSELDKEIRRVASLRSDLAEHIDVAVSNKTATFAEKMEERLKAASEIGVEQVVKGMNDALLQIDVSKKEFVQLTTQAKADWDAFNEHYKWLLSNVQTTKDTFLREVATVFDVHQAVEAMWNSNDKPDNIAELTRRYVGKVTADTSDLRGDENDYHNLAAECARHYLYDLSCKVCETGLKFFPQDIDLLADWIQYGTKMGDIDVAIRSPLRKLFDIDKTQWNWRAFSFTVDFYLAAGKFKEAEELADDFVLYCPYEERAYFCQAEVYQRCYAKECSMQKTIAVLQSAIEKNINCPMCANKLAELLSDCGRMNEALAAANRAIQELSQEQPSVNYGYVVYRRALIQDRLAYNAEINGEGAYSFAKKAIIDYQVAIDSGRLSVITQRQARVRLDMLKIYFRIDDNQLGYKCFSNNDPLAEDTAAALKEFLEKSGSL